MSLDQKKILLAEDEDSLRELYAMLLEQDGCQVVQARDGQEALQALETQEFDLILLDIMLPQVDGLQILHKLYSDPAKQNLTGKIIMLTNLAQDQAVQTAVSFGVRGYMIKSDYDPPSFIDVVTTALTSA